METTVSIAKSRNSNNNRIRCRSRAISENFTEGEQHQSYKKSRELYDIWSNRSSENICPQIRVTPSCSTSTAELPCCSLNSSSTSSSNFVFQQTRNLSKQHQQQQSDDDNKNNQEKEEEPMPGPMVTMPSIQTFRVSKFDGTSAQVSSNLIDQKNLVFKDIEGFVNHFCEDKTKARHVKKILVATNGIAAVKCILSMRKLLMQLFRNDRIIKFVCLTTEQEIQSKAEYLKMADYLVFSPAGANTNNYANVDEIVEHATRNNVDAVWAGWGHASENPRLPEELSRRNIVFIGPPSRAMFALGDKIASTIIAQTVNIPTIEWSGSGLVVPPESTDMEISKELYLQACVSTVKEGLQSMRDKNITYPVMIKASEGGGGKGIRKCISDDEFRVNFRRVQAEVPGSPIFIMKCMMNARHIEVQLIGDHYGQVIPIFTRDCSIQRRCQKIIEEAPAGVVPVHIQREMQEDAVNLAKKVGYVSAGTVEYMYLPAEQKYYFLELNPRLQVEHPCTEMVANINIPAIQLQIAMGIPLHRITEIRLFYGMDRYGESGLPEVQCRTDTNISVIAARITSEDPAEGFRPASGAVEVLNFQSNQNVWGYFSVSSTGKVHEFADSQFGHLFAKGTTRYEAISALLCALKELELRATFTSQVNYLVGLLHDKEFENNDFHTGWLDARIASKVQAAPELPVHVTVAIGATLVGYARISEVFSKFQAALERGQILPKSGLTETWELELVHNNVKYSVMVNRFGPINYVVRLNDSIICTVVRELGNGTLIVTYSDQAFTCHLEEETERFKVIIGKTLTIFEKENDPSMLRSKNAGRFLQYLKKEGDHVSVGEVYAEMESMKMVINLEVPKAGGRLVQVAQPGQVLFPGTLIARLEDQDDVATPKPKSFTDRMEEWDAAREKELQDRFKNRLDTHFEDIMQACKNILSGYSMPEPHFREQTVRLVDDLFTVMNNPRLPFALFKVMLHAVESRICRISSYEKIKQLVANDQHPFPAIELAEEMENYLSTLDPTELGIEKQYFESLLKICERFEGGLHGHIMIVVNEFLELFLDTEHHFQDVSYDKGVSSIKTENSDASRVVRMVYSHTKVQAKNAFLKELLSRVDPLLVPRLQLTFKRIANMFNAEIEPLAIYIRQTLNKIHQKTYTQICSNIKQNSTLRTLNELVASYSAKGGEQLLRQFVGENGNSEHIALLHEFFFTDNRQTNECAVRLFISKLFQVEEADIQQLPNNGASKGASFFRFELRPCSPFFNCKVQQKAAAPNQANNKTFVYYLTLVQDLDTASQAQVLDTLKAVSKPGQEDSTFLFIAHPREKEQESTANSAEPQMRQLAAQMKEEIARKLDGFGEVELMFSRAFSPPFYTTILDFSTKEKLELYRLPAGTENLTQPDSPYLIYRTNEHGLSRLFVRALLRNVSSVLAVPDRFSTVNKFELLRNKIVDLLDGACGEIRVCSAGDKTRSTYDCNHVFIRLDYDPKVTADGWSSAIEAAIKQCEKYLIKHRVTEVEVCYEQNVLLSAGGGQNGRTRFETIRVIYMNETGAIPEICIYRVDDKKMVPVGSGGHARLAGKSSATPHHTIQQVNVQKKRYQANKLGTTYVYDIPIMFGKAAFDEWASFKCSDPNSYQTVFQLLPSEQQNAIKNSDVRKLAKAYEIILAEEEGEINIIRDEAELNRRISTGCNDRGMIAWEMHIWTPDSPHGRSVVLISNDITFQMGSFSMREHRLYQKASEYSRQHRMPRVYVAANSGARIGFAADIKKHLTIVWNDEERPEEGFKYLALDCSAEDKDIIAQVESSVHNGHRKIEAVIGKENDIGVENLVGSGLIASETSAAYREVPTYCLVTGRAVGIGAYVARLSHRICQVESSHIILTGAAALNSVLGREVYTSNNQLGGPQIMYYNGVSHSVAQSDMDGVKRILRWITYLPPTVPAEKLMGMALTAPAMFKDDKARLVHTQPTKSPYDPRLILDPPEGGGLFDHGTFDEIMSGWAKTIITGRARLRGLPVGVVAVETRTVECEVPADPATQDSQTKCVLQAGQVWYPDSAFKTAEAINDFNREGLPLIFLANIRGFSGGQKDMFEMVLKFGSWIVDALSTYTQPVVVYLPPFGELRGGAWAVLDSKINPTCITMLADADSRGGVLEASGIVEIKFRERELVLLLKKCDPRMGELEREIDAAIDPAFKAELQQECERRKEKLLPICRAAAVKFADLHDTTARMLAKGAIHDEVSWQNARNYFFDLISVKTIKMQMARHYLGASGHHCASKASIDELAAGCQWVEQHLAQQAADAVSVRRDVHPTERPSMEFSKRTRYVYSSEQIHAYANGHRFQEVLAQIRRNSLLQQLQSLGADQREQLIAALTGQKQLN